MEARNSIANSQICSAEVSVRFELSKDEEECGRWNKVGLFRFSKGSVFLGMIFSVIATIYVYNTFDSSWGIFFLFSSLITVGILGLNSLIQRFRTLVILKKRLFFTDEILPRRITQLFGRLPERSIQELSFRIIDSGF